MKSKTTNKSLLLLSYVPLPKSATPSRIHANSYLYDFELSPDDLATLDALDKGKEGALMWNPLDFE
jgi:diketogulonate reductase-like aldo/keto reductase